jgi:hypothetical protein
MIISERKLKYFMDKLISIENLIDQAKENGIDFGKGNPYNRLRYYTKIGWLPHMVRKKDAKGNTRGHYPLWALSRLIEIESFKTSGLSNDDISKKLNVKTKWQSFIDLIKTADYRNQVFRYVSFVILLLILLNETGIITLGAPKTAVTTLIQANAPVQVLENGSAFVPKNQTKIFIKTPLVKSDYKIYVTFTEDYSPASRFWVSEIKDYSGFTVELDTPVFNNAEFNWWITN